MGPAIAIWEVSLAFVLACLQMEREKFTTFQYISCMYFKNKHEDGITDEQDNVGRTMVEFSGGTTCVWAPVREKHLGPHKMMTYIGRSGGKAVHKMLGNFGATFSISGNFSNFRQLFFYRATSIILRQSSK